jgi:protein Tex
MAALGLFRAPALSESLPPAFDPWFAARSPGTPPAGVRAALDLAAAGAAVPFIARYRKERTGNLDAAALRQALEARAVFEKILSRQAIMLESIERHATLTPQLRERILSTFDLDALEDLYHPYRQQKKNRALAAREAGLEPLAEWIWSCGHGTETPQEGQTLELWAFTFRNEEKGVPDARSAVEGARDILVERLAGTPELRALVRRAYFERGWLRSTKTGKAKAHGKFEAYFAFQEKLASLREPAGSHRYLAVRRGQAEEELQVAITGPPDDPGFEAELVAAFEAAACTVPESPGAEVLRHAARIALKNDVRTAVENEVHRALKEAADAAAARSFADSVRRRLLEPPFGPRPVLGASPGGRAGGHVAAVDAAGKPLAAETIHLQTDEQKEAARESVARLAREHGPAAAAVGNGPGGREAEALVRAALRQAALDVPVVLVIESGAGAWGTSEAARAELPDLDPGARGAVSIARRLQDPLAELVGLDLRSIGVGQYHHDVSHATLQRALDAVVSDCVHETGVDLNAAPRPLLARVSGLGPSLASAIVEHREANGPFRTRRQLLDVPGLGPDAFEQAAGFLRVRGGEHPLDATGVHPERYEALEALASRLGKPVAGLLGAGAALVREAVELEAELGAFTRADVVAELERNGLDPRGPFVPFSFRADVRTLEDLRPGMTCPGLVTNVTTFGVFVDVGVHHDGLVHVSQLGPGAGTRATLGPGDRVEVRVLKVDHEKKQISLTLRPAVERRPPARPRPARSREGPPPAAPRRPRPRAAPPPASGRPEGAPPAGKRPDGPRPDRARPRRDGVAPPRPAPAERRPEPRRQAFNNPFAVLADLKAPAKKR